jgi:hypothetical protein
MFFIFDSPRSFFRGTRLSEPLGIKQRLGLIGNIENPQEVSVTTTKVRRILLPYLYVSKIFTHNILNAANGLLLEHKRSQPALSAFRSGTKLEIDETVHTGDIACALADLFMEAR